MSKIYIGVAHRIDLESDTIKNPLYHHIRCGAALDERENVTMQGDNSGDNISEKRLSMCEYTVQYWMWKNVDADYYGLCHYRRYLSFLDEMIKTSEPHGFIVEAQLNKEVARKYNLLNQKKMKDVIESNDIIVSPYYAVQNLPHAPRATTERELWKTHPMMLIYDEDIDLLLEIIREKYPQYYDTAMELMEMDVHRGFNCFVMKKELFFKMCEFEFGVLEEFEKKISGKKRVGNNERTLGYVGEILYGVFLLWVEKQNKYKIEEKQIILFQNTRKIKKRPISFRSRVKKICQNFMPGYKTALRIEQRQLGHQAKFDQQYAQLDRKIRQLTTMVEQMRNKSNMKFWLDEPVFSDDMEEIKKRFWASYPKATGDARIIQVANSLLLYCFKEYCDQIGIKFWLHGGSLVGGLRHKGFVPWDDDVDLAMMRSDYQKLKKYLESNSYFEIAEFYYTGLGCRSYRFRTKDSESPFFVDIFLYDDYELKTAEMITDWRMLTNFKKGIINQFIQFSHEFKFRPENRQLEEYPDFKERVDCLINNYIERVISKNTNSEYLLWGMDNNYENHTRFAWHNGRIFLREDIYPLQEIEFEGMKCYAPANYEKYAYAEYGIGYLEMPNGFGKAVHDIYFKDKNISEEYMKLIEVAKEANISIDLFVVEIH